MKKIAGYFVLAGIISLVVVLIIWGWSNVYIAAYKKAGIWGLIAATIVLVVIYYIIRFIQLSYNWGVKAIVDKKINNEYDDSDLLENVVRPRRMEANDEERSLLWSDIKEFANGLSEHQLKQEAVVWGENDNGGGIYAISITRDDLINPSGEYLETVGLYANSEDDDDRETARTEQVIVKKGTIIIEVDF
jgi:hypothetical protein